VSEPQKSADYSLLPPVSEGGAGEVMHFDEALKLENGGTLPSFNVAYQTYGTLNEAKSNAIWICHAFTGDQFVVGTHPITGKPGWWEQVVGPGKPIDTDRFFIICANVLGGCMGTTGPRDIDPATGAPFALNFPSVTIGDMITVQARLLDALSIEKVLAVIGGSMGGMQVLEWAARFPARVASAICIASAARHTPQNIAFHEVGRQAIMADPDWHDGNYLVQDCVPERGLSIARMTAHITYLSERAIERKFGRNLQGTEKSADQFQPDFQVESYLRYQGKSFTKRFDANSYLYITRAMDYFDLAKANDGVLAEAFRDSSTRFCLISFTSDWLFSSEESRRVVHALNSVAANVSFVEIETDKGHDAFLLDEPVMADTITGFLNAAAQEAGV